MKKHNTIPVIKLIGDVAAQNIHTLSKKLESLIEGKHPTIVIDLNETKYIDSHGLGVFVYSWKMMEKNNNKLIFLNSQEFIRNMFEGTNLNQILTIVDNLEKI
jgi:anti-anti-sigma factor